MTGQNADDDRGRSAVHRRPAATARPPATPASPGDRSERPRGRPAASLTDTWLAGDGRLARRVGRPLAAFVRVEAAGAAVLVVAIVAGLIWANSPWQASYRSLWSTEVLVMIGPVRFDESLRAALNDGAMVLFFFVIGLEIKRELVTGSLRHPKAVVLPVAAAIGGMGVPAAIYAVLTTGSPGADGWAIPMPTDVALALGVLLLAGSLLPRPLVAFLLTLAVVDDIGVIAVIGAFYSSRLHLGWLLAALALLGVVVVLKRLRVWHVPVYVVVGTAVWYATWQSGVHATVAGVALGLLAPARPLHRPEAHRAVDLEVPDPDRVRQAVFLLHESLPVAERLQYLVQPWVAFGVLPLFALANAGIRIDWTAFTGALTSSTGVAVIVARLVGKPLGIVSAAWLATRLGVAHLPAGLRWAHVAWVGVLGGVGFTVSVYVASLAFSDSHLDAVARLAVLTATVVAATLSWAGLRHVARRAGPEPSTARPPTGSPTAPGRPPGR